MHPFSKVRCTDGKKSLRPGHVPLQQSPLHGRGKKSLRPGHVPLQQSPLHKRGRKKKIEIGAAQFFFELCRFSISTF